MFFISAITNNKAEENILVKLWIVDDAFNPKTCTGSNSIVLTVQHRLDSAETVHVDWMIACQAH